MVWSGPDRIFTVRSGQSKSQTVKIANRTFVLGISLGKVKLPISVNRYTRSIVLTDILYVPQIKGNLILVARL